ncbi:MAG: VaFE repeat-containing surface-anchored protein, partial [Actinobacteria bacterium]|nr:VaFE repeat-containing surface-anchored protein [Actinomycetota bacterium]
DTVAYHDLIPGTQYTVAGELMRASDSTGTGITGSTTFTPTTADDTVTVTFTVPSGFAGQSLVAFQSLYTGNTGTGTPIAVHQDINDTAQTVTLEHKPKRPEHPGGGKPHTGNGTTQPDAGSILAQTGGAVPIALTGAGVLALLAGVIMVAMRRRTRG